MTEGVGRSPRERLARRVSAASYGTILVLGSLVFISTEKVLSGFGWELVTGVGLATWVAHLYAEVVGDHVLADAAMTRAEIRQAMTDGLPILLAAVPPAALLFVGRTSLLDPGTAVTAAVVVGLGQLLGLGAFVGSLPSQGMVRTWSYAALTLLIGVVVVVLRIVLKY